MLILSACGPAAPAEEKAKTDEQPVVETKTGLEAGSEVEKEDVKAEVEAEAKTEVKKVEPVVTKVTVVGSEFAFSPSTLNFKAGEQVAITFKNDGKYPHNLVIRETDNATKIINSGETEVLSFTAPKAGSYSFYCSVAGHEEAGMKGALTVQ